VQAIDRTKLAGGALLLGIAVCWGLNWSAMAIALAEIPPWQYRAISALTAGVSLLALSKARGNSLRVPRGQWPALGVAALFYVTAWLTLIAYGVILMKTGQAALLAFTMPLWTALLSALVLGERITVRVGASLVLGLGGIALLLTQDFATMGASPWGAACVLGAAVGWAVATVTLKRVTWQVPTFTLAGWQFVLGSVPLFALALGTEEFLLDEASWAALGAMGWNTFGGFVFAYAAWFTVIRLLPAGVASIGTLLVPGVALIGASAILGDALIGREIAAMVLLCVAVGLVISQPAAKAPAPTEPEAG